MNTTTILSAIVIILVLGVGGWLLTSQRADDGATMETGGVMIEEKNNDAMMEKGSYEPYSAEKLALALGGDVLLFFHADWCPICRAIEGEISALAGALPAGVHILKVNYDTEIALRQKYGVTTQHTFVQVDADGTLIQKFSDAGKLSDVLARVK